MCALDGKTCEADIVLIVVLIWSNVLLLECKGLIAASVSPTVQCVWGEMEKFKFQIFEFIYLFFNQKDS